MSNESKSNQKEIKKHVSENDDISKKRGETMFRS